MHKITLGLAAAAASMALPSPATAQRDVAEFSTEDAEDLLAGEEASACDEASTKCPRTSNTRGFTFVRPTNGETKSAPQPKAAITKARPARPAPASAGLTTPRAAQARELPLQFKLGSYALSPQSKVNLRNLGTAMNNPANRDKRIRISGHTDKSGSLAINQRLSQQRADAAADYLATVGVDRSRIETVGRAYEEVLPGKSPYDPRNRRVEVERID
ncbi:OmpA family protein [Novosphingobium aquimarinum]|uniref:OmpA family protein n=1 Tax=Novosphingobium aquimarinum TaxID=2682494 RepID=UPI0018DCBF9E|nr:OmpA family protein [Novosphingobium aquimarinum]